MTYEENVQRIAEGMAREAYDTAVKTGVINVKDPFNDFKYSKDWIKAHLTFARIAVARMEGELKEYFNENVLPGVHSDMRGWAIIQFEEYLKDRGLIPAQEGAQDDI